MQISISCITHNQQSTNDGFYIKIYVLEQIKSEYSFINHDLHVKQSTLPWVAKEDTIILFTKKKQTNKTTIVTLKTKMG